jgi:hypothetical protein
LLSCVQGLLAGTAHAGQKAVGALIQPRNSKLLKPELWGRKKKKCRLHLKAGGGAGQAGTQHG